MRRTTRNPFGTLLLALLLIVITATGCKQQTATEAPSSTSETAVYTGALRADYENALDVTGQLALGVLRLEGTADAVTAAQAVQALPLWKTLQGVTISTQAERLALTKQLEGLLTASQVAAITAMQLTEADAQTWLQEQGPAAGAQGGQMPAGGRGTWGQGNAPTMAEEDRAAMRERFQNMTEEERATMQAQFGQGGGRAAGGGGPSGGLGGATAGVSTLLTRAVVTLLTERSGQTAAAIAPPAEAQSTSAVEPAAPTATATPEATASPMPVTRITLVPWRTPEPKDTPTPVPDTPVKAETRTATGNVPLLTSPPPGGIEGGKLVQKPDTDPGPPLTIEITTNYAEANPLLEGGLIYKIGGFVHNPTEETYAVTAVQVTFFDTGGFRGAFYAFPMRPGQRGIQGEWIWHGAMKAQISCTVLGPGESCPFTAEIAGQNMASFLVHPDAKVAEWHESVAVTLSNVKLEDTAVNYVRISGVATNPNPYPLKNVVISGLLLDSSGQTTSMGTGVVPAIAAGASANFEVYVAKKAYASYQLHARAEQATN